MRRAVVCLLAVSLTAMFGCGRLVSVSREFSVSEPWDDYERVVVRTRNGAVELRSADVEQVHVSGTVRAGGYTLSEAQDNLDEVTVHVEPGADHPDTLLVEARYPDVLQHRSVGASFVIEVPEPCAARIETGNGVIHVQGLKGEVDLDTSNGRVSVTDVSGSVRVETSNGRVEAKDIRGGLVAESSNGRITAERITGDCVLNTSNGGIRLVTTPDAVGRIELRSSNGSIHATVPEDLNAAMKLRTSNGKVNVSLDDAAFKEIDFGKSWFRGIANEGTGQVTIVTSNGSITVDSH